MSKKYQVVSDRVRTPEGGFISSIRMALVEFTCLGERRYDIAAYPHSDHFDAFSSDWANLGGDARKAIEKVRLEIDATGRGDAGEGKAEPTKANAAFD